MKLDLDLRYEYSSLALCHDCQRMVVPSDFSVLVVRDVKALDLFLILHVTVLVTWIILL